MSLELRFCIKKSNGRYNATCNGRNQKNKLHFIPEFPKLTEDVIFINNILYNLSHKTLEHLQYVFGAHDFASKVIEKTGRRVESIVDKYTIRITIMIKAENIK
jgi:hypothetical protein